MTRVPAALAILLLLPTLAAAADFVGSESCRTCHQEAYEHWRRGPHARAHLSLTPAQAKDPKCMQCHAPDEQKGGDPGVSCETCHGAGEYYWPDYVMKDSELARATGLQIPQAADCLLCHDASSPSLQAFDPAQKMKEIDHWSKSRQAREKSAENKGPCELPDRRKRAEVTRAARPAGTFLARALVQSPAKAQPAPAARKNDPAPAVPESRVAVAKSEATP